MARHIHKVEPQLLYFSIVSRIRHIAFYLAYPPAATLSEGQAQYIACFSDRLDVSFIA